VFYRAADEETVAANKQAPPIRLPGRLLVIDALEASLLRAKLWTDEENDVGDWRPDADAALALARGEK